MDQLFIYPLDQLPFVFLALVVALTCHEFAHAYTAYKFGDPTAKHSGRVTLNPRAHLDVLGTLFIFIAGFGWAKPVPVDRRRFKNPRLMGIVVSAAGPLSNLLIAFVSMFMVYAFFQFGIVDQMSHGIYEAFRLFMRLLIVLNLTLFIFNLIPLPPLDGYRIFEDLAPSEMQRKMQQYEQWAVYAFILIVIIPPLNQAVLVPIFSIIDDIFHFMDGVLSDLFGKSVYWGQFFL